MKLTYTPRRTVSTADLSIACDPPMFFEVTSRLETNWTRLYLEWEERGADNAEAACKLIGEVFVSVSQGGETFPIEGEAGAKELKAAIEESSPGEGDAFICHLLLAFARNHFSFLAKNSAGSVKQSERSNGTKAEKVKA